MAHQPHARAAAFRQRAAECCFHRPKQILPHAWYYVQKHNLAHWLLHQSITAERRQTSDQSRPLLLVAQQFLTGFDLRMRLHTKALSFQSEEI